MSDPKAKDTDSRETYFVDIDRMVNEGLGGGRVTVDNGLIEDTTADTLEWPESALDERTDSTDAANKEST
ncbi:hypothetical protein [Alicyclobacillus sp.]|uniref:hypothetical protein n=1 Tax=Alicyclobacillus sp. TaxID=61169 RepID=UPI0025C497D8|nr:hypothetical protein [Alicyclobacillus sp.]MCL6517336.1 hypothetical protein [Alicyclobacillus sp.]